MKLEDAVTGDRLLEFFTFVRKQHKYSLIRSIASEFERTANDYVKELQGNNQSLKNHLSEAEFVALGWPLNNAWRHLDSIGKLINNYDNVVKGAKEIYRQYGDNPRERDLRGREFALRLDNISRSLESEFSSMMISVDSYFGTY